MTEMFTTLGTWNWLIFGFILMALVAETHPVERFRTAGVDVGAAHIAGHVAYGIGVGLVAGAEESSLEQAKSLFDVNLFGLIRLTKAVLPTMRRQGTGRIVNLSSVMGLIPAPFMALYAASKHAVEGYSESLDHEIRGSGIRVVLVEPAYTRTAFEGNVYRADQQLDAYQSARAVAEGVLRDGMKTADTPEVVASAVVKAATEANPRRRYAAGRAARQVSLLRRFVPEAAFDRSLRKQMRLPA